MKVYCHYTQSNWKLSYPRLEGIYATRAAAKEQIPKNPNTTSRHHWIEAKTVKGIV